LSITVQPAAAAFGAKAFEASEPAANKAMSQPAKSKCSMLRTLSSLPLSPKSIMSPVERREATAATSSAGNSRSARMLSISRPTLPVAPTTTTR
jgi:hypothetical protein